MLIYLLMLAAFAADRITKWWVSSYFASGGGREIHPLLHLRPAYNRGIAFGMFQGIGPVIGWLSIAVVVALLIYIRRVPRSMWLLRIGIALIIGGAMGNLVDRITSGVVLDFISTPLRPGIFNVADIMINLGLVLSIISLFVQRPKDETVAAVVEQDSGQTNISDPDTG
jgi:signal peptidase II